MNTQMKSRRGMTLMELLIVCCGMMLLTVGTMRGLGEARLFRSAARDRSAMALVAQSELERLRTLKAPQIKAGVSRLEKHPEWPGDLEVTCELKKRDEATWLALVRVERRSLEGKPTVELATILAPGGAR